jgi:hypothetical protein
MASLLFDAREEVGRRRWLGVEASRQTQQSAFAAQIQGVAPALCSQD